MNNYFYPALTYILLSTCVISLNQEHALAEEPGELQLAGRYTVFSGERDGRALPEDRTKDVSVQITDEKMVTFDKDKKEVYGASYRIDKSQKPWRISMVATMVPAKEKEMKTEGLIRVDGNKVTLIYALPNGATPTDFKTVQHQQMFVLKRVE